MCHEVTRLAKCLATRITLKRPLSSVCPLMLHQARSVTKCLATNATLMWLPVSSVCPLMSHQVSNVITYLATNATLIWLPSRACLREVTNWTTPLVVWFERTTRRTRILEPIFTVFTPDKLIVIVYVFLVVFGYGRSAVPVRKTSGMTIAVVQDLIRRCMHARRHDKLWTFCMAHSLFRTFSFHQFLSLCRFPCSFLAGTLVRITFFIRLTEFIRKFSSRWHCRSFGSTTSLAFSLNCPVWVGVLRLRFGDHLPTVFPLSQLAYWLESLVRCDQTELTNVIFVPLVILQTIVLQRRKWSFLAYRDSLGHLGQTKEALLALLKISRLGLRLRSWSKRLLYLLGHINSERRRVQSGLRDIDPEDTTSTSTSVYSLGGSVDQEHVRALALSCSISRPRLGFTRWQKKPLETTTSMCVRSTPTVAHMHAWLTHFFHALNINFVRVLLYRTVATSLTWKSWEDWG